MTDRPWLVQLDDRDREQVTAALLSFAGHLARDYDVVPKLSGMGWPEFDLPGAMRVGSSRWAVRLALVENDRLALTAPAAKTSSRGKLRIIDRIQRVRDLADVPAAVARWCDEIGDKDPDRRRVAQANEERLRRTVRGCIHLIEAPWRRAQVHLSPLGRHAIHVELEPGQSTDALAFSACSDRSISGAMSPGLVAALDGIVAEGLPVATIEYGGRPRFKGDMPMIKIDDNRSLYVFNDDDGDAIEMMRTLRSVPAGARLLMPFFR